MDFFPSARWGGRLTNTRRKAAGSERCTATLEVIKRHYFWIGMSNDVKNYVRACDTCTQGKTPKKLYAGLRPLEKKALETMQLKDGVSKEEIKARYKELVKEHHPDANGGDPRSADKLREVIQAYNHLKTAGMA